MPDTQIHPIGTESAPADYVLPKSVELLLKGVYAKYDGSGTGGSYVPLLRIISDAGTVAFEIPADDTIAAGASADVTWFPRVGAAKPSGSGIQYDVNNTGDWLSVEASGAGGSGGVAMNFIVDNDGGYYVNDNGNGGINLNDAGSGGIQLSAASGGVNLFSTNRQIKLETEGPDEPEILLESVGGIVLQDNNSDGDGGITLEVEPGNYITMSTLPTSDPGVSGAVWNNAGVLHISP